MGRGGAKGKERIDLKKRENRLEVNMIKGRERGEKVRN